jgi:hypothetical protein
VVINLEVLFNRLTGGIAVLCDLCEVFIVERVDIGDQLYRFKLLLILSH